MPFYAGMEHGSLMVLLLVLWHAAELCARAALAVWLVALITGMAVLIVQHALITWRRRRDPPRRRAGAAPSCSRGLPE